MATKKNTSKKPAKKPALKKTTKKKTTAKTKQKKTLVAKNAANNKLNDIDVSEVSNGVYTITTSETYNTVEVASLAMPSMDEQPTGSYNIPTGSLNLAETTQPVLSNEDIQHREESISIEEQTPVKFDYSNEKPYIEKDYTGLIVIASIVIFMLAWAFLL